MAADQGARRASVGLSQAAPNPGATLSTAGEQQFQDRLSRNISEPSLADAKRQELREKGLIRFAPDGAAIPDVGGPLRRTKTGHIVKNQAYFSGRRDQNKWDLPAHAGVCTWKFWHGPRLRTDAPMMQRLDAFEAEQATNEAHKISVNTVRLQTLDRFYNQKLEHEQYATATSWAPHRKTKREVHDLHATFTANMDEKPVKELKKVLTGSVLKYDRQAIRQITQRMQVEETWKDAWKQWEQERRNDLIADLEDRKRHNTMLQYLSGQPVREPSTSSSTRRGQKNPTGRVEDLSKPRAAYKAKDVTANTDFRGLVHVDHEHALEAMFPGLGHNLAVELRKRATDSTQPGWPPPVQLTTPRKHELKEQARLASTATSTAPGLGSEQQQMMSKVSVPVSPQRMEMTASRRGAEQLAPHAQAQFLPTRAPPAPDQRKTLMKEDWSPKATMNEPMRVTGTFSRTDVSSASQFTSKEQLSQSLTASTKQLQRAKSRGEQKVPPVREMVYPVKAPTSPQADKNERRMSFGIDRCSTVGSSLSGSPRTRRSSLRIGRMTSTNTVSLRAGGPNDDSSDDEEYATQSMPRLGNFFRMPSTTGRRSHTMSSEDKDARSAPPANASAEEPKEVSKKEATEDQQQPPE